MDLQRRCLGIGSVMIVAAVILRLLSAGAWQTIGAALESPETAAFLLYLETGRIVHPQPEPLSTEPSPTTLPTTVPTEPVDAPVAVPCFGPMDAALVDVRYHASYRPDLQQMVTSTLRWDLCADEPTVLILSSHATESYDPKAEPYTASGAYRTLDTERNMISIGSYVADLLENAIAHLARFDILAPHGIIVAEHPVEKAMPALAAPYRLHRTYRYGKISLTVYRRDGNQNTEE
jgi:hypothetical protein